jgi:hypothetical protein
MADFIDVPLHDTNLQVQIVAASTASKRDMMLFKESLLAVWSKIPRKDKKSIENHWQIEAIANQPAFILDNPWFGESSVWATTESKGLVLKFNCELLGQVADHMAEVLDVLMAHEMAHVFQWATGKNRFNLTTNDLSGTICVLPPPLKEEVLVELHADETMMRWGFDPYKIDAWSIKYMIEDKRQGSLVPRKKPLIRGAYTRGRQQRNDKYWVLNKP